MSDPRTEEAQKLAQRAGSQGKNAAKNTGRAARAAAEPVVDAVVDRAEDVADGAKHASQAAADRLAEFGHDAANTAKKVNSSVYKRMAGQTLIGTLALTASVVTGLVALDRFVHVLGYARGVSTAKADLAAVAASAAKADHHIRPSQP